jgi:hypothetical protein
VLINRQVVAGAILHRVNNKLIMLVGALGYVAAFLLYSLNKTSYGYWPMIFPGLCCAVVGADLQFNVTNASKYPMIILPTSYEFPDVRHVVSAKVQTKHCKRHFPNSHSTEPDNWNGRRHNDLRQRCNVSGLRLSCRGPHTTILSSLLVFVGDSCSQFATNTILKGENSRKSKAAECFAPR